MPFLKPIFIVDMVFLGDTRSAEELAVFTNMAPERLCLGCGLRVDEKFTPIFPGFQNERFARCFRQFSRKICVSLQFRAIDTPIPTKGFIRKKQNVPRTTTPCIPKFQNVRFATAACTKMYESIHREPTRFAHTKMWGFTTVLADRHHVFTERVHREQMKFAFRYSFGRSTPRFYREGSPRENEICVSLQFWAIDTTFLLRGFTASKWNLRFATVLGDRHHVFTERVHREQMKFAFRYSFGRSTTRF